MGRKVSSNRKEDVVQTVRENDGKLRAAGVAKVLNLHPQEVNRPWPRWKIMRRSACMKMIAGFWGSSKDNSKKT